MRFEEQVSVLCAQALAAMDEHEVQQVLTELRRVLHEHIEELRSGLLVAYTSANMRLRERITPGSTVELGPARTSKTWEQIVREIARESDHCPARPLGIELRRLLRGIAGGGM
jgi:hypothetical protein